MSGKSSILGLDEQVWSYKAKLSICSLSKAAKRCLGIFWAIKRILYAVSVYRAVKDSSKLDLI